MVFKMEDVWVITTQEDRFRVAIEKIVAGEWFPRYMVILKKYNIAHEIDGKIQIDKEVIGECADYAHSDILFARCMSYKFPEANKEIESFFEEMGREVQRRIDDMLGQEVKFIGG